MAIQQINLGSMPLGAGGDTQRAANEKINQNFSNTTHAASRLVGTSTGNVVQYQDIAKAYYERLSKDGGTGAITTDLNELKAEGAYYIRDSSLNHPKADFMFYHTLVEVFQIGDRIMQRATGHVDGNSAIRMFALPNGPWTDWRPLSQSRNHYARTTSVGANLAVIDSSGTIARVTSSEKYKNILGSLTLDDELYEQAMAVKPIVYRSKANADPNNWHFMSFSAEQLGELDPALTFWKTHETDPETGEQVELEQREAEGINLNAICAVLHATNIKQDKKLKELEQRLTALESNNEPIE